VSEVLQQMRFAPELAEVDAHQLPDGAHPPSEARRSASRASRSCSVALGTPALAVTDLDLTVELVSDCVPQDTLRVLLADTIAIVDEPIIVHDSTVEPQPESRRAPFAASAYAVDRRNSSLTTSRWWTSAGESQSSRHWCACRRGKGSCHHSSSSRG
jgi:hypothetical protein